jgi:hypothetical protein
MGQLAPRYLATQVEAQLEEIHQEAGDYPVQLQLEMVEPEHQEVQTQEDFEEDPEEVVFEDNEAEEQPQLYDGVLLEVDADGDIVIPLVVGAEPDQMLLKRKSLQRMLQAMIQMIQEMIPVAAATTPVRKKTRMRMKMKKMRMLKDRLGDQRGGD